MNDIEVTVDGNSIKSGWKENWKSRAEGFATYDDDDDKIGKCRWTMFGPITYRSTLLLFPLHLVQFLHSLVFLSSSSFLFLLLASLP